MPLAPSPTIPPGSTSHLFSQRDMDVLHIPECNDDRRNSTFRRSVASALIVAIAGLLLISVTGCASVPVMPINYAQARTLDGQFLPPEREYWLAFRQPSQFNAEGLYLLQPYEPGKVPLILVHGLASDAFTWDDIIFALKSDPVIAQKYQIWVYQYPTGVSYLRTAADLRRELIQTRSSLDPNQSDRAFDETVLIGHSMGGLLSRLQISHSDDRLWRSVTNLPMEETIRSQQLPDATIRSFVFEPVPFVRRVIYIATPHRGSNWTIQPLGQFSRWLIELPQQVRDDWKKLVREDSRFNSPADPPTSLDHLTPGNPIIVALNSLRESNKVSSHSIIGTGYLVPDGYIGDGVVPLVSTRKPNVQSEFIIRATHSGILKAPPAMTELVRLLRQ